MPGRRKLFGRDRDGDDAPRLIRPGDTFTIDEDRAGLIRREQPSPSTDVLPWYGEPWAWRFDIHPDAPPEAFRFQREDWPPGYREPGDDGPDGRPIGG